MQEFNVLGLANTFAIIDIILHTLFHVWISLFPRSYEWIMNVSVAGLHLKVTKFDSRFGHILFGTVIEAGAFWLLGATVAVLYNYLAK
ncbi:hypothetical protein HY416_01110 [Candidatus Kaiserbacteria bacterium]|nr:hypothetical protein [Candidatus Kaiserbacteria bacterium]